jgi:hypothetical protein
MGATGAGKGEFMGWKLSGHYVASCTCQSVCPCPTGGGPPTNPDGTTNCWAIGVWNVRQGNLDSVDLSGIRFGLSVNFPDVVTAGNWKIGVTVNDEASDEQVTALTEILSGQQGGPFADMAPMIGEFAGVERGAISYSDSAISYGGSSVTYEPSRGADGHPTVTRNAVLGFAPEFEIGRTSGSLNVFGHAADASYGEAADFEYTSEAHEGMRA